MEFNLFDGKLFYSSLFFISTNLLKMIFQMESVVRIRPFVEEMSQHGRLLKNYSSDEWQAFEEITKILKHPYDATLRMQREQYCPSDFYGDLENLKLELQEFSHNSLANEILRFMEARENKLKTPTVLASVFIDPRYRLLLSESESTIAISHILKLRRNATTNTDNDSMQCEFVPDRKICHLIEERKKNNPFYQYNQDESEFIRSILALPLESNINVSPFEYWTEKSKIFPEIYFIHCIVNAASPTQTSVERSFSGLSYILSSRRTNIHDDLLNRILLLRLNFSVWKNEKYF